MTEQQLTPDDPRYGLAHVAQALGGLLDKVPSSALADPTPCPDFTVEDLLDHLVLVMRRVAVVGDGGQWASIQQERLGGEWSQHFTSAAGDVHRAWTDGSKLKQEFDVPWGRFPGGPVLYSYTGELAVHGWDLATALGTEFAVEDELLHGALMAAKMIPADGREGDAVPFGPVVDPGPDASVLDQMAGWMGRPVA